MRGPHIRAYRLVGGRYARARICAHAGSQMRARAYRPPTRRYARMLTDDSDRWRWAFAGDRDSGGGDARMRADRESAPRRRCPCWRCASAMIHCTACARGGGMRGTVVHRASGRAILLSVRARAIASGSAYTCAHVQMQETGCRTRIKIINANHN